MSFIVLHKIDTPLHFHSGEFDCSQHLSAIEPRSDDLVYVYYTPTSRVVFPSSQITSPPPQDKSSKDSTAVPSDEDCLKALRRSEISRYFPSDSNVPWFESLFPGPVPQLTDSKLDKECFNKLFKSVASQAKTVLKRETSHSFAHLPKSIAAAVQNVIQKSVKKSTESKCPQKVVKKAVHLSSSASPSQPRQSEKKNKTPASSAPPATPKVVLPPKKKAKATSSPAASPQKSKSTSSPAAPATQATVSQIVKILQENTAPRFYFSNDAVPTFRELFPGTTMPQFTRMSGNVHVAKEKFNPLLASRVKSAHNILRAKKISVTKLPAAFLKYQTRLITRSIEKQCATKKQAKADKKAKTQSKKKEIQFVKSPIEFSSPKAQPASSSTIDNVDVVFDLRSLRSLLQAAIAEKVVASPARDPRVRTALLEKAKSCNYDGITFRSSDNSGKYSCTITEAASDASNESQWFATLTAAYTLVSSRTSLSYEASLRD